MCDNFKKYIFNSSLILLLVIFSYCTNTIEWKPAKNRLFTKWAKDVSPDNVWPQYPRPILKRQDWETLNGLWDYTIRDKESLPPKRFEGKILVPFAVESPLSGVKRIVGPDKRLWYRRYFYIPESWRERRILLHFEAVDWETRVWINGDEVGVHRGGYDPFTFDISGKVKMDTENEILLSVWDPTDAGSQPRGKQVIEQGGIFYTPITGIWQSVWMEPVPSVYITDLRILPDIDKQEVEITIICSENRDGYSTEIKIIEKDSIICIKKWKLNQPVRLSIKNPKLWSPDSPHLYDLEIKLMKNGKSLDVIRSYFGMRKISLGKDEKGITRIMLNNKFLFQIGPLDQGYWPDGLLTPPTEDAYIFDLNMIKKYGFNMLRKHVKIESRRFYSLCDSMGIIVWQDMPSGFRSHKFNGDDSYYSGGEAKQFELELKRMIESHINNCCIVMWIPFNEGWGQHDTEQIVKLIRSMDPTRIIDNASGWTDVGAGDVVDIHAYPGPSAPEPEPYRAAVLGEFGGLGLNISGHTWKESGWGYKIFESMDDLMSHYESLYERLIPLIDNPGLSGAVYTQISDIETENNGLMTYDRKVLKIDPGWASLAQKGYFPPRLKNMNDIFIDEVDLEFIDPLRGGKIYYTLDGKDPTKTSDIYTGPIHITERTTVKAVVVWENGKMSRIRRFDIRKVKPLPSVDILKKEKGLILKLYKGEWDILPDFSKLKLQDSFIISRIDLSGVSIDKRFGLELDGYIDIPETGVYRFYLSSDDGSRLLIHGREVIINNGIHGMREKSGTVALEKGLHPFTLEYFQRSGGLGLKVYISGKNIVKQEIGTDYLYHKL